MAKNQINYSETVKDEQFWVDLAVHLKDEEFRKRFMEGLFQIIMRYEIDDINRKRSSGSSLQK
jgi:hypothetical protein